MNGSTASLAAMRYECLLAALLCSTSLSCSHHHAAPTRSAAPPPPPAEMVRHSGRLWIVLAGATPQTHCVDRPPRRLCFQDVQSTFGRALRSGLWPAFPEVQVKEKGDDLRPGDYVLVVTLTLDAEPPRVRGPGWAATASGKWQLVRDGLPLAGESLSSRSRAAFAYGSKLGDGAGEVLDAVAVHIARTVGALPETQPQSGIPLPAVRVRERHGSLFVDPRGQRTAASTAVKANPQ